MTIENLKLKIKGTMMLPQDMKKKLLAMDNYDDNVLWYLNKLFGEYGHIEDETVKYLQERSTSMAVSYIHEIEKKDRKLTEEELLKLEKYLNEMKEYRKIVILK